MPRGNATTTLEVEIFGSSYKVRGGEDSEHLYELAGYVDEKMKEIATQTATVDTTKIAILAALNIADELWTCRGGAGAKRDEVINEVSSSVNKKVAELAGRLQGALSESAADG